MIYNRRQGKPWWSEHLSLLWVNMCTAEKYWLKSVSQCLTSIIDSQKKRKLSTFTAFIDFKKAYNFINRDKLWSRISNLGISGKILNAD